MSDEALTTVDNPFNPFEQFKEWYQWDVLHGYNTCGYFAQIVETDPLMSEIETAQEESRAMHEIVSLNVSGMHRLVTPENFDANNKFVETEAKMTP